MLSAIIFQFHQNKQYPNIPKFHQPDKKNKLQFPQENRVDMATINITDLKQLVPSGQENKDGRKV